MKRIFKPNFHNWACGDEAEHVREETTLVGRSMWLSLIYCPSCLNNLFLFLTREVFTKINLISLFF